MGLFTSWDDCGEGGSSISPLSELGGAILWPVSTFLAMSGVELIIVVSPASGVEAWQEAGLNAVLAISSSDMVLGWGGVCPKVLFMCFLSCYQ